MRWIAILVLGALLAGSMYAGFLQVVEGLAEFGAQFGDDERGRFEAAMLLVTCLILMPFAALAVVVVAVPTVILVLENTVFPISRSAAISDGVAALATLAVGFPLALLETDLPVWSIQGLGTIARAWIVVMS